jgi:uncharacterized protein YjbI with pentapeptide repeats
LWHSTFRSTSFLGSAIADSRITPAVFDEVDLMLTSLGGLDLRGLDLTGARLRDANLVGTDLRKATLRGVDFGGARTSGLRLNDADLRGSIADATFWTSAVLDGARIDTVQALAYVHAHGLTVSD